MHGAPLISNRPTFGQNKLRTGPNLVNGGGIKLLIGPILLSLSGSHLRRHLKLSTEEALQSGGANEKVPITLICSSIEAAMQEDIVITFILGGKTNRETC